MPQMAPMNWTMLFIVFNLILLFLIIINYFYINYNPSIKKLMFKTSNNWKW